MDKLTKSADSHGSASLWKYLVVVSVFISIYRFVYEPLFVSTLSKVPGPKLYALSKWFLAYQDWKGSRTSHINDLHHKYGDVVRIGPNEVHFNNLAALKTIYGAGSGFERHSFYRMFDAYGRQNLFTFAESKPHSDRKKLLNHAYSKTTMMKGDIASLVEEKVRQYLRLLDRKPSKTSEIFSSLHYFAIDSITAFLYGHKYGATKALRGSTADQALLIDIMDHSRKRLSWFAVHFPRYTKWLYTRTGFLEKIITRLRLFPMAKPSTYSGIRAHALQAFYSFKAAPGEEKEELAKTTIIGRLWTHQQSEKGGQLDDLDIASECADHLLAGIDTTSDSLMFLLWALSRSENKKYQDKLISEVAQLDESSLVEGGIPSVVASDRLPYLAAIVKETLRLYNPLPASEPRDLPVSSLIAGYEIPAKTVVGMSPFSLHRNPHVFPEPLQFDPERWLRDSSDLTEMNRWWWAFSSGGRMCIGLHLAMAEMTTLVAAIYRTHRTGLQPKQEGISPGITSRFEVFADARFDKISVSCYADDADEVSYW